MFCCNLYSDKLTKIHLIPILYQDEIFYIFLSSIATPTPIRTAITTIIIILRFTQATIVIREHGRKINSYNHNDDIYHWTVMRTWSDFLWFDWSCLTTVFKWTAHQSDAMLRFSNDFRFQRPKSAGRVTLNLGPFPLQRRDHQLRPRPYFSSLFPLSLRSVTFIFFLFWASQIMYWFYNRVFVFRFLGTLFRLPTEIAPIFTQYNSTEHRYDWSQTDNRNFAHFPSYNRKGQRF